MPEKPLNETHKPLFEAMWRDATRYELLKRELELRQKMAVMALELEIIVEEKWRQEDLGRNV